MRLRVLVTGFILSLTGVLFGVVGASAASINVTPASVPVGGTVTLSGDVLGPGEQPGAQPPGTVFLISPAFAGQGQFMNMDVDAPTDAAGKFNVVAKILPGVAPGTYTISGRFGGGNIGVQATLTVTPGNPVTGVGSQSAREAGRTAAPLVPFIAVAGAAGVLVTLGLWTVRRRHFHQGLNRKGT